jgi:hypothetical protein
MLALDFSSSATVNFLAHEVTVIIIYSHIQSTVLVDRHETLEAINENGVRIHFEWSIE